MIKHLVICFSKWETKHLIYSGLVLLTYIHYLDTTCQGFSQISLKSNESKNTLTYQNTRWANPSQTFTNPKCFSHFYNERERGGENEKSVWRWSQAD